ncbi:hypothetical protein R6Q59_028032 [Mikania micrantha]|uniref:BHLH domain-containing protein n=1 Tax=Mikania micrantha TaxID=192012 RepID=A0A5N6M9W7_9ASTR|nr:hypothetical protein E3N88_32491 [Mikania micrantha]
MMEHKRSPVYIEQGNLSSLTLKKHKAGFSMSSKEKKDKIGDRIAALQQLVSPFGKTDTASVLHEALAYINFLHDQVKVLSAPYLHSSPAALSQELESYDLKSKGLRLVPVSYTIGVDSSNGADLWAPIKTSSPKS